MRVLRLAIQSKSLALFISGVKKKQGIALLFLLTGVSGF